MVWGDAKRRPDFYTDLPSLGVCSLGTILQEDAEKCPGQDICEKVRKIELGGGRS